MHALALAMAAVVSAGAGESVRDAGEAARDAVADASTTARIETMYLLNDHLSPFNINTTTENGVVTLSGGVETQVQKELAEDLARSFESVRDVVNRLEVMDQPAPRRPKRTWRQRIEDKTVTASVRTRLLYNRELKGLRIGVTTERNVVTLSGVVDSEGQKYKIGLITFDTRGVAKVVNHLTVRPKEPVDSVESVGRQSSDEWVEKRVETSIMLNRHLSIRAVDVEVDEGVCILTGTVDTESERRLAAGIAESIQGVREVRNDLEVREAPASAAEQP